MGTNFYMMTKNKQNNLGDRQFLTDEPNWGYAIHIAKTSVGWPVIYEAHENIKCVNDIKTVYDSDQCIIYDEYNNTYDWYVFVSRVVDWGVYIKLPPEDEWATINEWGERFYDGEFR